MSTVEKMRGALFVQMTAKFGLGLLLIGILLFVTAGSARYINGWIFLIALAVPMAIFGVVLLVKSPAALERRLKSKEPDKTQRAVIWLSALQFLALFVLSGLNYRFSWPAVPLPVSIAAVVILLVGYAMFSAVTLQNAYAARVVDVFEGQKLISTGLYALVRHPMYTATLLIFLSIPFILGSWIAAVPMLLYPVIIVLRIRNEEALLVRKLPGYQAYTERVRYRLIPLIW